MLLKRVLGAVVALACVTLLSSCSLLPPLPDTPSNDNSQQKADVVMEHIADAVKHHDSAALEKLFSSRAREKALGLDSGLKYFLSFFPSGRMTWTTEGTSAEWINEYPKETEELHSTYKVFADGKKYDLYFSDFTINTAQDPKNVGLYALGVAPYTAHPLSASGVPTPFYAWQRTFGDNDGVTGSPGVYVPHK